MSRIDQALRRAHGERTCEGVILPDQSAAALDVYTPEERRQSVAGRESVASRQDAPVDAEPGTERFRSTNEQPSRVALPAAMNGKLLTTRAIANVTVEQYRRLAGTLHDVQSQRGLKTLMVSSAVPREGKTLTIANLALALSSSYQRRVLLVDADLRRPAIHGVFGIPNGRGLVEILRVGGGTLPLVQVSPGLHVLTAGTLDTDPLARLTSDGMQALIHDMSTHFDWILVDTPPVGLLPDAQQVARMCDAVLFVIAAGSTPYTVVQRSIAEVGTERVIGTVLNRVEQRALIVHEYYDGYYSERPR